MDETQETVFEWCEEHYPGESTAKKLINLLEEVTELGCVLGVDPEAMQRVVALTIAKSDDPVGDVECTKTEVGDVQLSIWNLAEHLKLKTIDCINKVMKKNRLRKIEESQARVTKKIEMGITE